MKRMKHADRSNGDNISLLSGDVHTIISSFLGTKDALMYSQTCKVIRNALDFQIIPNVNTIPYQYCYGMDQLATNDGTTTSSSSSCLCKELIPSLPSMIGKYAMHSYRIRCDFEEGNGPPNTSDNQTFFIKTKNNDLVALFIVDSDNRDLILIPRDADQRYYLCHPQIDDAMYNSEIYKMNFHVDVLVHGIHCIRRDKGLDVSEKLKSLSPKVKRVKYLQACES